MNKKSILLLILELIFLVVFNSVFFILGGTEHVVSVWISFGFINFSYLTILLTSILTRQKANSKIFGLVLYSISTLYFFAAFIVGIIFILLKLESYKVPFVIQFIISAIFAVAFLANLITNDTTAEATKTHKKEVSYIKEASLGVKAFIGCAESEKVNKAIEKLYDLIHSSPSKSSEEVKEIESEILRKISNLGYYIEMKDEEAVLNEVKATSLLVEKRNTVLRKRDIEDY